MSSKLSNDSILKNNLVVDLKAVENPSILYNPITLSWLPKPKPNSYPKLTENDKGIFELIQNKFINSKVVIGLLDISIPQYISAKYHHMDIELIGNSIEDEDEKYATYMSWYSQYCTTFGLEYLNDLQNGKVSGKYYVKIEQNNPNTKLNTKSEQSNVSSFAIINTAVLECLGKITKLECTPPAENCIKKSIEFLSEPGIIIQLPWNTTMFHQWLALAMLDVLTFEKYTLELREWYFSNEILSCVTELLLQVRTLKERIMLGFLILCQQIQMYPKVDPKYPAMIMDHVVMPSLPTLAFIQPGKSGHKILQSIKLMSWSKSCDLNDEENDYNYGSCIFPNLFTVCEELSTCFENTCYGFKYWLETIPMGFYNPKYKPEDVKIESIIDKIGKIKQSGLCEMEYMSSNEAFISSQMTMTKSKCDRYLSEFIENDIVKKGRIPEEHCGKIERVIKKYCPVDKSVQIYHLSIINEIRSYLYEHEKETGILRRMIILQLENIEREKILTITKCTCDELEITPIDINTKKYKMKPLSIQEINVLLHKNKTSNTDKESIWLQFQSELTKPINVNESQLILDNKPLPYFFKECSDRVGRIIVNIARQQFEMYEKGGVIYPHWLTVQYLLPCYVSILIDRYVADENLMNKHRTLALIHGILQYYEQSAVEWSTNIVHRKPDNSWCEISEILLETIAKNGNTLKSYLGHVHLLLTTHLCPSYQSTSPRFYLHVIEMTLTYWWWSEKPADTMIPGCKYLNLWLRQGVNISKELYDISMKSLKYPNKFRLGKLQYIDLYELNESLSFFMLLVQTMVPMILPSIKDKSQKNNVREKFHAAFKFYGNELFIWRFNFYLITLSPTYEKVTSKYIAELRKEGLEVITTLFDMLKQLRELFPVDLHVKDDRFWNTLTPKQLELQRLYVNNDMKALEGVFFGSLRKPDRLPIVECKIPENISGKVTETNVNTEKITETKEKESEMNVNQEEVLKIVVSKDKYCKCSENECKNTEKVQSNVKICRNCQKNEEVKDEFIACKKCIKDKYPDVNYFCNEECEASWWKIEHMAEHLEFELGLLDLSKK